MKKLAVILMILSVKAAYASSDPKLSIQEGRALVLAALSLQDRSRPKLDAEVFASPDHSRFMVFTVTWQGTSNGSVVVGNYAVDPFTADVWSGTIACHEEANTELEKLQRQMRRALHLTAARYQRLKTKGPLCE